MARSKTKLVLIDDTLLMHGFRVLMSGARLEQYQKNPVLLIQHIRGDEPKFSEPILPIGKMTDVAIEGSKLVGFPEFDDDDELAKKVESKYEKGYMNGASIWLQPISVSDDPSLKLEGQTGPTVTEWSLLETSIVDVPNCHGALAIRNAAGQRIALSADGDNADALSYLNSLLTQNSEMKKDALVLKLGLPATADEAAIETKLTALLDAGVKLAAAEQQNTDLRAKVVSLQDQINLKEREKLVDDAILDGKLAAGEREPMLKLAAADLEAVKSLITARPAGGSSIQQQLAAGQLDETSKLELQQLSAKTGKELYLSGQLDRLKVLDKGVFKLKYKEAFGVEFKD